MHQSKNWNNFLAIHKLFKTSYSHFFCNACSWQLKNGKSTKIVMKEILKSDCGEFPLSWLRRVNRKRGPNCLYQIRPTVVQAISLKAAYGHPIKPIQHKRQAGAILPENNDRTVACIGLTEKCAKSGIGLSTHLFCQNLPMSDQSSQPLTHRSNRSADDHSTFICKSSLNQKN